MPKAKGQSAVYDVIAKMDLGDGADLLIVSGSSLGELHVAPGVSPDLLAALIRNGGARCDLRGAASE